MRVLIVGCGYVGLPLGAELAGQGHEVFGLRRSPDAAGAMTAAGIKPLIADIVRRRSLEGLPAPFDWVVNSVSSSKGDAAVYREVFLQGARNLIEWLAPNPPKKFVYTSSTSVYGQNDGSLVKEDSPTEPAGETGRILVETERELLAAAKERNFPAIILRVAGIYGPQRGRLFLQYLRGEARISQADRLLNMVHRDDVVGGIVTALKSGRPGEVYNVADDEPVTERHFFHWLADSLGKEMPPAADEGERAGGKRAATNKRVCNRKLKMELGYQFLHPTFREGYTAELTRLERLGELEP